MDLSMTCQVFIFILTIAGFVYQSYLVCDEYFKYTTTTSVMVVHALPATNVPQVAICKQWSTTPNLSQSATYFNEHFMKGKPLNATAGHLWGDPQVTEFHISGSNRFKSDYHDSDKTQGKNFEMTKFIQRSRSCFAIRTRNHLNITPSELFTDPSVMTTWAKIAIKMPFFPDLNDKVSLGRWGKLTILDVYMTAYDSDFNAPLVPERGYCNIKWPLFMVYLSYAQRVTNLFPPPYDTNCQDYRRVGSITQSSCLAKCINEWTLDKHRMFFDDYAIKEDRLVILENSVNNMLYSTIEKEVQDDNTTADYYKEMFKSNNYSGNKEWYHSHYQRHSSLFSVIRNRVNYCKSLCSRPDCTMEYIIPQPILVKSHYSLGISFDTIDLRIFPPKEPIIHVTSQAKLKFLDLLVYILTCLSFWFGFCPLSLGNRVAINNRKRKTRKRPKCHRSPYSRPQDHLGNLPIERKRMKSIQATSHQREGQSR